MRRKIVVIGGSAAGPKAAARAKRINQDAEIVLLQKSPDFSMASCGYPYYVGGVFDDRNSLICSPTGVIRDSRFFLNAKGITAKNNTEAVEIDRSHKRVSCRNVLSGETFDVDYDKLILTTGAAPFIPPVPGTGLDGLTTLQSMKDADYLRKIRDEAKVKKAVIIGGGLIGIETCEALQMAGIEITIVEMLPQILTFLDAEMAKLVENHIISKGVEIITGNGVSEFLGKNGVLTGVRLQNGTEISCELAVVAAGVRPNTLLAEKAGIETGKTGGIIVNKYMQTSDPDIYAAGDCIETVNTIYKDKVHAPMGDLANIQGRAAGENAASENKAVFSGTVQTGICRIFDFTAGSTGLSETALIKSGVNNWEAVINASPDKPGFMTGKLLVSKMMVEKDSRKIIGYQCLGPGDVSKQLAVAAMAVQGGFSVDQLVNLDLPYAPPFSLAVDHFIAGAHIMQNKLAGLFTGITAKEVKKRICDGESLFLLDARGPAEFDVMRLGIGETLIPLGTLRSRINELPVEKDSEIICFCKISLRGYEAARILMGLGYTNVKVLEGGIMGWPFKREK